ncbi:MAG: hypothetical protein ACPL3B_06500 [Fervidobacterium sp.]
MESIGIPIDSSRKAISEALKSTASSIWLELRNIFKLEAYVKSVEGDKIILAGASLKLAKPGFIFEIETGNGTGYVRITGYNKAEWTVIANERPSAYDIAIEYPRLPMYVGLGALMFSDLFGIGFSVWSDGSGDIPLPIYIGGGTLLGHVGSYTPLYATLGLGVKLLELERIGAMTNGGVGIIGLIDFIAVDFLFGAFGMFADGLVTYEFTPKFGIYGSFGYNLYLGTTGPTGIALQLGVYF